LGRSLVAILALACRAWMERRARQELGFLAMRAPAVKHADTCCEARKAAAEGRDRAFGRPRAACPLCRREFCARLVRRANSSERPRKPVRCECQSGRCESRDAVKVRASDRGSLCAAIVSQGAVKVGTL
jgi:hypothetical protein